MSKLQEKIIKCIHIAIEQELPIEEHTDLRGEGLDSLATVELVMELEDAFDIQFEDTDMIVDNFFTMNKIVETLTRYGVANE